MTKEENIVTLNEHLDHWKRLLSEKICDQSEGEKTIDALQNAIKALEQEPCEDAISRQAVIDTLTKTSGIRGDALKALYDLPPVTPQPCDDAISRQSVLDLFNGSHMYSWEMSLLKRKIEEMPSITAQPKMGKWIDIMVGDMPAQACDQCNTFYPLAYTGGGHKFCPNCGQPKMQEVEG